MKQKIQFKGKLTVPQQVANVLEAVLKMEEEFDQEKEHFWVFGLKSNNSVKFLELVSLGVLDSSLVHPREVFRMAIHMGVASIILAHNHPSGGIEPSQDDKNITKRLVEVGKIIDIPVLDHVILGGVNAATYCSFREIGLMDGGE